MTYKIEKVVPIPEPYSRVYHFDRLEIGDCFQLKVPSGTRNEAFEIQSRVQAAARSHRRSRNPTFGYRTRSIYRGKKVVAIRFWRVE